MSFKEKVKANAIAFFQKIKIAAQKVGIFAVWISKFVYGIIKLLAIAVIAIFKLLLHPFILIWRFLQGFFTKLPTTKDRIMKWLTHFLDQKHCLSNLRH